MDKKIIDSLLTSLLVYAKETDSSVIKINIDSINKTLSQLCDVFKDGEEIKINDSLLERLLELVKSERDITNLQKIALSKEISPQFLSLTPDQEKIRKAISKKEADLLFLSKELNVYGNKFVYNNNEISREKIKEAISTLQLFDDISLDEILEFSEFLYKFPYLSTSNPVGQKILFECENIQDKYITILATNSIFYRARVMKSEDCPFSEQEMNMAPFKKPGQGRFNTQGVSRFYLTDKKEDAANEVNKHAKEVKKVQIAEYTSTDQLMVLNLKKLDNNWAKKCMKSVNNLNEFNVE